MGTTIQPASQSTLKPGDPVGEKQASTNLRVVDPNQLPGPDGKTPNVATEFKMDGNGQSIQVGSKIVPPPPHDPNNDEGVGSVFWRGFKTGIGHPGAFFSTADAMKNAALNDSELSAQQFQQAWNKGAAYDDWLMGAPFIGSAFMAGRGIGELGDQLGGYLHSDGTPPPQPVTVDTTGDNKSPESVVKPNGSSSGQASLSAEEADES